MNDTTNNVPEGFRPVDLDWSDIPAVDWQKQEEIMGVVAGGKYATYERKGKMVCSGIIKLVTEEGAYLVWESAQLVDLFVKLRLGDSVLIRFLGKMSLGEGRTLNKFQAYIKPGENRAQRTRALGLRPSVVSAPPQQALPGIPAVPSPMSVPEDFDDDIPF